MITFVSSCREKNKTFKVGVSQCSAEKWRWQTNDEILRELMFHPDLDVEIRCADDDNNKQIADIQYFIDNDFDIIIANPNEEQALSPILARAYEKGIPVITFDRRIASDSYTTHIEVDNAKIGQMAARYAIGLMPRGRQTVIELQGDTAMSPARLRHEGFVNEIRHYPEVRILASEYGRWNPDLAKTIADSLLRLYPDVGVIYAHSDVMAMAASEVAKALGLDGISFIGVDGLPEVGLQAVADSTINASFIYSTYGYRLLQTAADILHGVDVPHDIYISPLSAADRSNIDILLQENDMIREDSGRLLRLHDQLEGYWSVHRSQTSVLYATIVIVFLLCVVLFLVLRTFIQHRRHNKILTAKNSELEEARANLQELYDQLDRATRAKLLFYTNASHDLRTPLTLIAEPVEQVISSPSMPVTKRELLLKIASRNVRILRRLIDQILDFHKYESGSMELRLNEIDFREIAQEWVESFITLAHKRHINLVIDLPDKDTDMMLAMDTEKMERVFFNMMSNAFKHTPDHGTITFRAFIKDGELCFSVSDNGEGIATEDLEKIFERFYQTDRIHPDGSGIGLALTRAFVELHGGHIHAESEHRQGATFIVTMPVTHTDTVQDKNNTITAAGQLAVPDTGENYHDEALTPAEEIDPGKPLMLVIDDNRDLRTLLSTTFEDEYNVITAADGSQGLRLATKYTPDIIVCDVMMPGIDGMECCRRLKNELSTSHIPVLMLTACALDEQRLKGYESGADGYLAKPFDSVMFRIRCRNLIENRRRITHLYQRPVKTENYVQQAKRPQATPKGDIDSEFYTRFLEIVSEQMHNPDLSIGQLADMIGLSGSQLAKKIKSLTDFTPVELLRNIRLNEARRLIICTDRNIKEIAFSVGFSLPAYFTK
ncbi:MAG: substrate-binding domain-containing protein, partial [Muribaculaceae bacterium]|nr:substrate-binding domain-containing protein [Muribaculaceae bacterium]